MAGDDPFPVHHVSHAVLAQVDAADHIVKSVVFINAYHIHGRGPVLAITFLHRHAHGDAKLSLKDGVGICSQVIRFLEEGKKMALKAFRRAVDPLNQPPLQVV